MLPDNYNTILAKLYKYCAYQERCKQEVRKKLKQLGVENTYWDRILLHLEAENFLNEFRFAHTYVRGKFAIKRWGKQKIFSALREKGVEANLIRKALNTEIAEEDYLNTLHLLLEQKMKELQHLSLYDRKQRTGRYLYQKGYEMGLIRSELQSFQEGNE